MPRGQKQCPNPDCGAFIGTGYKLCPHCDTPCLKADKGKGRYVEDESLPKSKRKKVVKRKPQERSQTDINKKARKAQHQSTIRRQRDLSASFQDIGELPLEDINWKRRLETRDSLELFGKTYLPAIFNMPLAQDHYDIIQTTEEVVRYGGQFSLAMPRGGGKTAWMRAATAWCSLNGLKDFLMFIGSNNEKAKQSLEFLKVVLAQSPILRQDFPEVCLAFKHLERKAIRAIGQHFHGNQTHIIYGAEDLRYPSLILSPKEWEPYAKHLGEDFLRPIPAEMCQELPPGYADGDQLMVTKNAGAIIRSVGIDGSIRGDAETHPILLSQPRPDLVLLDDVQKDSKAESPTVCEKLVTLIEGAVAGLAGPGETLSCVMPCTVIREGDVSDTFLTPTIKPEWRGKRCKMVLSWPEGITDHQMSLETKAGKMWHEYREIWIDGMHKDGHHARATEFYRQNREVLDDGFEVSWKERFKADPKKNGPNVELSAQQHAMNLRLKSPDTFPAEYQNNPHPKITLEGLVLTAGQLAEERTIPLKRGEIPHNTQVIVAHIDVQDECFFYTVCAFSLDFSGVVTEYGTWPPAPSAYYTKAQLSGWKLLSREFFDRYPDLKSQASAQVRAAGGGKGNHHRKRVAPFEAKLYFGLQRVVGLLMAKQYPRNSSWNSGPGAYPPQDVRGIDKAIKAKAKLPHPSEHTLNIQVIGIDSRWGKSTDVIKKFVTDLNRPDVIRTQGFAIPPQQNQLEEYTRHPGWIFEDAIHRGVKEVKWVWRPGGDGLFYLQLDVNRLKTFVMSRLSSPVGAPGSVTLHEGDHRLFADHICNSEYPEQISARGLTKDVWQERDNKPDNDYLDTMVGCMALASTKGCAVVTPDSELPKAAPRPKRSLKDQWAAKKKASRT